MRMLRNNCGGGEGLLSNHFCATAREVTNDVCIGRILQEHEKVDEKCKGRVNRRGVLCPKI